MNQSPLRGMVIIIGDGQDTHGGFSTIRHQPAPRPTHDDERLRLAAIKRARKAVRQARGIM